MRTAQIVEVIATGRLHFGLLSFASGERRFGGVGLMVRRPSLKLTIEPAEQLESSGPFAARILGWSRQWAQARKTPEPPVHLRVTQAARQHVGLGTGTQLALSVAAGLNRVCGTRLEHPADLARSVGRGARSAVGTFGFAFGGFIVERGRAEDDAFSTLDCRIDFPHAWRIVLMMPADGSGLSGQDEQDAFGSLPEISAAVTDRLLDEVYDHMLPAVAEQSFDEFSQSVYRYGHRAGLCFAKHQGGPYNGHELQARVDRVRELGVEGVGQSSWGPTLFAFLPSQSSAEEFVNRMRSSRCDATLQYIITAPCNRGAQVCVVDTMKPDPAG